MESPSGNVSSNGKHDVDGDGIPDDLDAVNLPSEAQALTTGADFLNLAEGLPQGGFAVLIEPSHHAAQLVVADAASTATAVLGSAMAAQQALNQIETLQGVEARNALAMVINDAMSIKYTAIAPEAPSNLTLNWNAPAGIPADGSWLLINTDPTRLLSLSLAGNPVALAARATSHFSSTLNSTDYRWQFLNLHLHQSFCYDPATFQNGTTCLGNAWPGWIRAYSGQAAYALEAVRAGLASRSIPLTTPLPPATQKVTTGDCPPGQVGTMVNGVSACFTPPTAGLCPAPQVGVVVNNQTVCASSPTVGACPPPSVGINFNGQGICITPPTQNPCPPGMVGFAINDQGYCFTVPGVGLCPTGSIGIVLGSTTVCAPLPTAGVCPAGQVGVVLNGTPVCVTTNPCGPQSASSQSGLDAAQRLVGNQSQLVRDLNLARSIHATHTNAPLLDAVAIAKQASQWEAAALNQTLPSTPVPQHASASQAARVLLAEYNVTPTPAQNQTLRGLDNWTRAGDLAHLLDAFLAYQNATRAAYQNANWTLIQQAALLSNHTNAVPASIDLRRLGVNLGRIYPTRNQLLDAYVGLFNHGGGQPTPNGVHLDLCPAFAIDLEGNDTTYPTGCAFILDVGGNDRYLNNGGGSNILNTPCINGEWAEEAAALIDASGNDVYANPAPGSCGGVNGGGSGGAGFLFDQEGNDTYAGRIFGVNGGSFVGAGFLMDLAGNDHYTHGGDSLSQIGTNGGGDLGSGFLFDGSGNDFYDTAGSGGNGAGVGGVGFLLDRGGNDTYGYPPDQEFSYNSDGLNGAGQLGTGFLMDESGNDTYQGRDLAVNGGGALGGTGFLLDMAGNDNYIAGSTGANGGANQGTGFLLDLSGNDTYTAENQGSNGEGVTGFGLLVDGAGTDHYLDQSGGTGVDKTVAPKGSGAQIDLSQGVPCSSRASAPAPQLVPAPMSVKAVSTYHEKLPALTGDSRWQLLGNQSYAFPTGIGIDYALDPVGLVSQASLVTQVADSMLNNATHGIQAAVAQRLFKFQGAYYSIPTEPRNLTRISLGIESLDGNHAAQTFLIDGKRLAQLLDLRGTDHLKVNIDRDHRDGFAWVIADVNGDGIKDVVVKVPHFSPVWLDLTSDNAGDTFGAVKLTTPTTGWLTGYYGLYRFAAGHLTRYEIPGINFMGTPPGLHVVSDTDFYVTGGYWDDNAQCYRSFIYRYHSLTYAQNAFTDMYPSLQQSCNVFLQSIWMNPAQSLGYAAGSNLYKFTGTAGSGTWSNADAMWSAAGCVTFYVTGGDVFDLNATGAGTMATWMCTRETVHTPTMTATYVYGNILKLDGNTFTRTNGTFNAQAVHAPWAIGVKDCPDGAHRCVLFKQAGNNWNAVSEAGQPSESMWNLVQQGTKDSYWFLGNEYLYNRNQGTWSTIPTPGNTFYDADFKDNLTGLAVGTTLLLFLDVDVPIALGSLNTAATDTLSLVTADGSLSRQAQNRTFTQSWAWGDGTTTTGVISTHRYNAPGAYTVTHLAVDPQTHQTGRQNLTVTVSATNLNVGGAPTGTLPASTAPAGNYYVIPATSGDRYVRLTTTGTGLFLTASLDSAPPMSTSTMSSGSWPAAGSLSSSLVGKIPSNHPLIVSVQKPAGDAAAYTLTAATVPVPGQPTTTLVAGTAFTRTVGFSATTVAGQQPTQLAVIWGDNTPDAVLPDSGYQGATTYPVTHTYTSGNAYTITITSRDDLGQASSITRAVSVYGDPVGVALPASLIAAGQAQLNGRLDSLGGKSSVTATFKVYQATTLVDSNTQTLSGTTPISFSWTKAGLTAGTTYMYTATFDNAVATVVTGVQSFSTTSSLAILPQIVSSSGTVSLGATYTMSLKATATSLNNVAYFVTWDANATEVRYPTTGFVPWNQAVSASTTYAFAGTHAIQVRMTDTSGGRGSAVANTATITGGSPTGAFTSTSQLDTITLLATKGVWGQSTGSLRFWLQDAATHVNLSPSSWVSNPSTTTPTTWTSPTLDRSKTYTAWVELSATGGGWTQGWTTPVASQLRLQTNRAPTLVAGSTPSAVGYLDAIRFSVTYQDAEGDAPPAVPTATVNGFTYSMELPIGKPDYRTGVEYHYNLASGLLPQGRAYTPNYQVLDQYGRTTPARAGSTFMDKSYVANLNFTRDQVDTVPQGTVLGGEPLNYWHVADTESADLPGRLASGHHGKAVWFGNGQGTYMDPRSGTPMGTLSMLPVDLGQVQHPTLSFSSYYETEDLGTTRDVKLVEIRTTGAWQTLYQVSGYEGGYGAWRTQHVDLSAYAGQVVQIRFTFDATDPLANQYLGWFIDDVAIGHDQDADTLPDVVEQTRQDVLVANQYAPVQILGGGDGTSYVRRLVRPYADSFQLEALISSSQPAGLTVSVGVTPSPSDPSTRSFTIYSGGADRSGCTTRSGNGIESYQRPAVVTTQDGLSIRLDLVKCAGLWPMLPASVFAQPRNWFLKVQSTAGAPEAWIEALRIVASGKTKLLEFDTNRDHTSDGAKVNSLRDALGSDADQDGLVSGIDPDDTVPSWAPALRVSSSDYTKSARLVFQDLSVPLAGVSVDAVRNATQQTQHLSATYQGAATWTVNPGEYNYRPDVLVVRWRDAYGTTGAINFYMPPPPQAPTPASYHPTRIHWQATDGSTQKTAYMSAGAGDGQSFTELVIGQNPSLEGWSSSDSSNFGGFAIIGIAGTTFVAGGAATVAMPPVAVVVGVVVAFGILAWWAVHAAAPQQYTITTVLGDVVLSEPVLTQTGLTLEQATDILGHGSPVQAVDGIRFLRDVSGGIGTMVVLGNEVKDVVTGWIWAVDSNAIDYGQPSLADFFKVQRFLAQKEAEVIGGVYLTYMTLLATLRPDDPCTTAPDQPVLLTSTSPNLTPGGEAGFLLNACVYQALAASVRGIDDALPNWWINQNWADTTVGTMLWGHLDTRAALRTNGNPAGEGGHFNWYWDDLSYTDQDRTHRTDCNSAQSSWPNLHIRRCNGPLLKDPYHSGVYYSWYNYSVLPSKNSGSYHADGPVLVPDFLAINQLDWQSRDATSHHDAFSAKGFMLDFSRILGTTKDLNKWLFDRGVDLLPQINFQSRQGYVSVTYSFTDIGLHANIDVRQVGP